MKKYVSIICSMIIVVFTVLSICVPVFASEHDYEEVVDDYKGADDTWYQIFDYRLEGDNIVLYNYDRNLLIDLQVGRIYKEIRIDNLYKYNRINPREYDESKVMKKENIVLKV